MKIISLFVEEDKLKHLEHPEDRIMHGKSGFSHAFKVLHSLHKSLSGKASKVSVSTKYDGAPSIVFGTHPDTGVKFVASKSAWNKTPKINTSHEDIARNHPNSPGLRSKLGMALDHLPKVMPKKGVYQGDLLYTQGEVKKQGGKVAVTPNVVTYATDQKSKQGRRMASSKLGMVVHTKYEGKTFAGLKSSPITSLSGFKKSRDVHIVDPSANTSINYPGFRQERTKKWLAAAHGHHRQINYAAIKGHEPELQTYVNSTVRSNNIPSVKGYYKHLISRGAKEDKLDSVRRNHKHFDNIFKSHRYLELAKTSMIHAMDPHNQQFETSIGGQKSGHEGYVANGRDKIVKRRSDKHGPGFSVSNFNLGAFRKT
jgi:hypothetical protein